MDKRKRIFKISENWAIQSKLLKAKFPGLTLKDLKFEKGKEDELLERIGKKVKLSRPDLIRLIQTGLDGKRKEDLAEVEKGLAFIILEIVEFVPNSVVIKTIIKKTTGNVTAVSFDSGEALGEKTSPFDTFIQIIEGTAEIFINEVSLLLKTGESIIIPAHSRNNIKANERFKMISTTIKSGYEEVS